MALKRSDPRIADLVASRLRERLEQGDFAAFFGSDVVLVPAPGHAPPRDSNQQSATYGLVEAMRRHGLGTAESWLRRKSKVAKAAWALPGERPTTDDHYDTIAVVDAPQLVFGPTERITVVDDVITSGSTLFACARRLQERFPNADVTAFAVVRTLSGVPQIEEIVDPVETGRIALLPDGRTRRTP